MFRLWHKACGLQRNGQQQCWATSQGWGLSSHRSWANIEELKSAKLFSGQSVFLGKLGQPYHRHNRSDDYNEASKRNMTKKYERIPENKVRVWSSCEEVTALEYSKPSSTPYGVNH